MPATRTAAQPTSIAAPRAAIHQGAIAINAFREHRQNHAPGLTRPDRYRVSAAAAREKRTLGQGRRSRVLTSGRDGVRTRYETFVPCGPLSENTHTHPRSSQLHAYDGYFR
jgi:hypothetical protein